ncbi:MAG: hypothetical protein ACK5LX_00595 [Oscillospiraceae bacterium]
MENTVDLTAKVREYKEYQRMADELAETMKAIQNEIKDEMTRLNVDELTVDIFKVRWASVVSKKFDSIKFKKTHAELYDQYCKEVASKRFTVS